MKAGRAGSMGAQPHRETQSQRKAGVDTKVTCLLLKMEVPQGLGTLLFPNIKDAREAKTGSVFYILPRLLL